MKIFTRISLKLEEYGKKMVRENNTLSLKTKADNQGGKSKKIPARTAKKNARMCFHFNANEERCCTM